MKGTINKKVFAHYMSMVGVLKDEADFIITEEGVSVKAIDPASVCMVKANLCKEAFDEYETGLPKALKGTETENDMERVCLPVSKIIDALKLSGDMLEISSDKKKGMFTITSGNLTNRFRMLEDDSHEPSTKTNDFVFLVSMSLKGEQLKKAVKATKMIKGIGNVIFECNPFGVKISADDEGDGVDIDITKDGCSDYSCEKPCRSEFSVDYLGTIFGTIRSSDMVKLSLNKDYPLKIEYNDLVINAEYFLAPRITSDDEPEEEKPKKSRKGNGKRKKKDEDEEEDDIEVVGEEE